MTRFALLNQNDNKCYLVEMKDGKYSGYRILDHHFGISSFRTVSTTESISIKEEDLDILVTRHNRRVYLWQIIGKILPFKDSDMHIIV